MSAGGHAIGGVRIRHPITLAPMEEHTNHPFRLLMKQHGASLVCSERVDAIDVAQRQRRAIRLLHNTPQEGPRAGQISGGDAATMAEAARVVEQLGFNLVDLNFECPIRRLLNRGEGGALLAAPAAIGRLVAAVVRAVSIPVTIKIRTGPGPAEETAVAVANEAEQAGAAAIDVHCRSVAQGYVGGPDWNVIERVKRAVRLPVHGSGGIRQADDALSYLRQSGADAVAIGRGCLGNPWIFASACNLLQGLPMLRPPSPHERGRALLQLVQGEFQFCGVTIALRRLARTSCYFAKFLPGFAAFREAVHRVKDLGAFRRLVKEHFQ